MYDKLLKPWKSFRITLYITGQFPEYTGKSKYDLFLYTLNLSIDNYRVNIVPTHAAPHYSLWSRAFGREDPHASPPSFPRQSHIVFLRCFRVSVFGTKAITWSPHVCNRSCHLCQQQETVQKPQQPSTETVIRPLQCTQFKGLGRWYCSVNSLSHPSLWWNPIHSWQSIQANYINSCTSLSKWGGSGIGCCYI